MKRQGAYERMRQLLFTPDRDVHMQTRKISAFLVDRANYGRLLPLLTALRDDPRFELQLILGGSFVLERFGSPYQMLADDGLTEREGVRAEFVYHEIEGDSGLCKALSIGAGVSGYAQAIERQRSDWALVIGDRFEALAAAQAAVYTGRCLVHVQGGEVSGTLDELARHAITKLAHYHLPATQQALRHLVRMGEHPKTMLTVGCPSSDLALRITPRRYRPGRLDALVMFHPDPPDSTLLRDPREQMTDLLLALSGHQWDRLRIWWPNIDAGAWGIHHELRNVRERSELVETVTNLPPVRFLEALRDATILIGNSSSFVRDAGYFGTPVVLVGHRQDGRERAANVLQVEADAEDIHLGIWRQLNHGPYPPSRLYGHGDVARELINALSQAPHYRQKRLHYAQDLSGADQAA
jgi:UDP-hydrolysing UDP-N-acetyl-D-glucosamine 2-epimerase